MADSDAAKVARLLPNGDEADADGDADVEKKKDDGVDGDGGRH